MYVKVRALIFFLNFYKFTNETIKKNYRIDIFDSEGMMIWYTYRMNNFEKEDQFPEFFNIKTNKNLWKCTKTFV